MRVEAKWLVRLILKDLGLEVPARSIMQGFHKDMYRMYLRRGDLRVVCEQAARLYAHPETAPIGMTFVEIPLKLVKEILYVY